MARHSSPDVNLPSYNASIRKQTTAASVRAKLNCILHRVRLSRHTLRRRCCTRRFRASANLPYSSHWHPHVRARTYRPYSHYSHTHTADRVSPARSSQSKYYLAKRLVQRSRGLRLRTIFTMKSRLACIALAYRVRGTHNITMDVWKHTI